MLAFAATSFAARPNGSDFSCRASAARVVAKPLSTTIEPIIANAPDAPCVAGHAAILNPTAVGPITLNAAEATTVQTPVNLAVTPAANGDAARASATVTNPVAALGPLTVKADVLSATASYTCQNGSAVPAGSSMVVNLSVNGNPITLPPNNAPFTLDLGPLGSLSVNQTISTGNRITQRALSLTTPLADVVIGEATADVKASPCAKLPQCSDGVDNDGDGKIDAQDPGCLSGPGGTYNPADDDERDTPAPPPAAKPQCSDSKDNDGDGKIDAKDPGCLSGPGGTYNPNDNDETDTAKPRGTSSLTTIPTAIARLGLRGPCTKTSFAAVVRGRSIDRVLFLLDGRTIKTDTSGPFTARISTGRSGVHRVTAKVTFLSGSRTKSRTLGFSFRRCAAPVRFTG